MVHQTPNIKEKPRQSRGSVAKAHRISWISSICVAKVSALTSLILLGGGLAGSKPIRGWNPLFAKKGDTFVVSDLVLLLVNSAKGSQSGQSSWR